MARSDLEIVNQTNEVAREIYANRGYTVSDNHKFYEFDRVNYHPHELEAWRGACAAQMIITQTDPQDALDNVEEELQG